MKTLKYFLSTILIFAAIWSCTDDEMGDISFVETVVAPTNISALFNLSQDNTGTVTITPNGEGPVYYDIYFGDDTPEPEAVQQGDNTVHVYEEGVYTVRIVAIGITGLITEFTQEINVSFRAPENLEVLIENDLAISKQVNVVATADFAMTYDVYFGENEDDDPLEAVIGESVSFVYQEAGIYTIRVVAKGGAIETTEYTEEFEVTAILQPLASAPQPPSRQEIDYVSIFSDAYTTLEGTNYNPDWGQSGQGSSYALFDLNGDEMLNYINLSYQGIALADGTSADVSMMEFMHIDVWTADATDIEISLIQPGPVEAPVTRPLVADQWNSFDIPLSEYFDQGLTLQELIQLKLVGTPWAEGTVFVDNIYFYKEPTPSSGLEGTWKLAPEAGALKVGPSPGNGDWWSSDAQTVIDRACFFDDTYVFADGGEFSNVLGADTWLETWQGVAVEGCGTPVAPHDDSNPATFLYDAGAGTLKVNGTGAYLGIPKANNDGELPNVAVPTSITYDVTLEDNDNTMIVSVEAGAGVFWTYKLVRDGAEIPSPVEGIWKMAPEAGSLKVGPAPGSDEWWSIDDAAVTERACFYDDTYVFAANGSFSNILDADTWVEGWQGGSDSCETPIAPHDGSANANYSYDATAGTIMINGTGAYLGIPKANNEGELPNVAVPNFITYNVVLSDNDNTMIVSIEAGAGVFWTFKLIREGTSGGGSGGGGGTGGYDLTLPIDFENTGFGTNWSWNVFENDTNLALEFVANPSVSGINTSSTVAKITALQTGQPWVGTETAHGEMGITWDLSASNAIIKILVYKTVISDVGIKLVNPNGGAQEEIKVANTMINEWEELTFNFSGRIGNGQDGSTNIDQIVIFPDFDTGGRTSDNVVYFDNITFGN